LHSSMRSMDASCSKAFYQKRREKLLATSARF
jgi:hypothetical protein